MFSLWPWASGRAIAHRKHPWLRAAFREVKQAHPFNMKAVVILPDYLHFIWTLPEDDDDFSTRWQQIKAAFSRQLPDTERCSQSRLNKDERGILQRQFWGACDT